ncbi:MULTISPECIES: hypothetical protein [unclassified Oceanobacter]|jgi:tetratricopeptide (TPR) repeat protein|uniref:hypothetical protein n=1 Tax=unclassified Oceanobacter TaxID=2620260 RepID=UPI0026E48808|nr:MULTISPECIES: hypothetical protein [unclassified Oceanobacter]MDO6681699.1 hypothetical protein [Oceanobacter sp. 5_MG-2023]MDP2505673.1 hypothetical protein [Oceanobacter sp. 3_MG-2023]MDP2547500.1 hypothetical protein [Oceanobacter sp. 4_MG-2023]MDP2608288.1 hypothetical protein [Oceanobacter sp. 1_MG-2023]MDP2612173.1 hypothetical protein [Oceanobacter sp. 2_MG-2023]
MLVRELFNDAPLSPDGLISLEVQRLLREPIDIARDWHRAERLLQQVAEHLPDQLEVQIALYKMYAYANCLDAARQLIGQVLQRAAQQAGFQPDWRLLSPDSPPFDQLPGTGIHGPVRLYLYSLKALGFVSLRAGHIELAEQVLTKLLLLDPRDEVGGSVVYQMALSLADDDS